MGRKVLIPFMCASVVNVPSLLPSQCSFLQTLFKEYIIGKNGTSESKHLGSTLLYCFSISAVTNYQKLVALNKTDSLSYSSIILL